MLCCCCGAADAQKALMAIPKRKLSKYRTLPCLPFRVSATTVLVVAPESFGSWIRCAMGFETNDAYAWAPSTSM
jgi:hypothetical protein